MKIVSLCENIGYDLFAIGVGSPVQSCAFEVVQLIQVNKISEVQERHDYIFLGRKVKRVESGVCSDSVVSPMFLDQVFYDTQMTIEGRIEKRRVPLIVTVVDPLLKSTVLACCAASCAFSSLTP